MIYHALFCNLTQFNCAWSPNADVMNHHLGMNCGARVVHQPDGMVSSAAAAAAEDSAEVDCGTAAGQGWYDFSVSDYDHAVLLILQMQGPCCCLLPRSPHQAQAKPAISLPAVSLPPATEQTASACAE